MRALTIERCLPVAASPSSPMGNLQFGFAKLRVAPNMAFRTQRFWRASLYVAPLMLAIFAGVYSAHPRGLPAQEGIGNFGRVSAVLYRGAQPDAIGLQSLDQLGIKSVINLRMADDVWAGEESEARAHGILYTNVPMHGMGRPAEQQVRLILELIDTLPGPVFIHCQHGCDRTGTVVACYRILHDKWSNAAALQEARRYGMSPLERGMRRCVLAFGTGKVQHKGVKVASDRAPQPALPAKAGGV